MRKSPLMMKQIVHSKSKRIFTMLVNTSATYVSKKEGLVSGALHTRAMALHRGFLCLRGKMKCQIV